MVNHAASSRSSPLADTGLLYCVEIVCPWRGAAAKAPMMTLATPIIGGCVILYECDVDLRANLSTYAGDLDMLIVIDNSVKRDPVIAAAVAQHAHAEYVFNGANLGIAAALNQAARWAQGRGADFLLTMDQDSSFDDTPFRVYRDRVLALPFLDRLAIAAPYFLPGEAPRLNVMDSKTVITSGSIVSLANHVRIGPFDERLFIDEVDHDYCLRAHDMGLRVVTLPYVRLEHRLGQARNLRFASSAILWNVHTPIRHYYMVRNGLYMAVKHRKRHPGYCVRRLARLGRTIAVALLMAPRRRERLGLVAEGIRDFLARRMGARTYVRNLP